MDKKEGSSTNFMPDDLLEVICILERGKKHSLYKIIRKGPVRLEPATLWSRVKHSTTEPLHSI